MSQPDELDELDEFYELTGSADSYLSAMTEAMPGCDENAAFRVIDALEHAGYVIVPRKPTKEMTIAGLVALVKEIEKLESEITNATSEQLKWFLMGATTRSGKEVDAAWSAMCDEYTRD